MEGDRQQQQVACLLRYARALEAPRQLSRCPSGRCEADDDRRFRALCDWRTQTYALREEREALITACLHWRQLALVAHFGCWRSGSRLRGAAFGARAFSHWKAWAHGAPRRRRALHRGWRAWAVAALLAQLEAGRGSRLQPGRAVLLRAHLRAWRAHSAAAAWARRPECARRRQAEALGRLLVHAQHRRALQWRRRRRLRLHFLGWRLEASTEDAPPLVAGARFLARGGHHVERAVRRLRAATGGAPEQRRADHAELCAMLARALLRTQRPAEAEAHASAGIAHLNASGAVDRAGAAAAWAARGEARLALGQLGPARSDLARALLLQPAVSERAAAEFFLRRVEQLAEACVRACWLPWRALERAGSTGRRGTVRRAWARWSAWAAQQALTRAGAALADGFAISWQRRRVPSAATCFALWVRVISEQVEEGTMHELAAAVHEQRFRKKWLGRAWMHWHVHTSRARLRRQQLEAAAQWHCQSLTRKALLSLAALATSRQSARHAEHIRQRAAAQLRDEELAQRQLELESLARAALAEVAFEGWQRHTQIERLLRSAEQAAERVRQTTLLQDSMDALLANLIRARRQPKPKPRGLGSRDANVRDDGRSGAALRAWKAATEAKAERRAANEQATKLRRESLLRGAFAALETSR